MDVKVSAKGARTGPIDWDIDGKKPHKSVLDFKKGAGPLTISFKLHDSTGRKLRFDRESPIWAHASDAYACPPRGASSDELQVVSCDDRNLTVTNANSKAGTIHYQLNFVDEEEKFEPVDPMIRNGGGGGSF